MQAGAGAVPAQGVANLSLDPAASAVALLPPTSLHLALHTLMGSRLRGACCCSARHLTPLLRAPPAHASSSRVCAASVGCTFGGTEA